MKKRKGLNYFKQGKKGFHPDYPVKFQRGEINAFISNEFVCPFCNRKGKSLRKGHATISGRQTDGTNTVLKVFLAFCQCGEMTPLFTFDYAEDLLQIFGPSLLEGLKGQKKLGKKCLPGTYIFLSGQGPIPFQNWIPQEILFEDIKVSRKCKNCNSHFNSEPSPFKNENLIIQILPNSGKWEILLDENKRLFCLNCDSSYCLKCCTWEIKKTSIDEGQTNSLNLTRCYIPSCPKCNIQLLV